MLERDQVFRERLIALTEQLNAGANNDKKLRQTVGLYASRMPRDAGARDWADLKQRADGSTYDSMLKLFTTQAEEAHRRGDTSIMQAMEVLALSLIARRQYQPDLAPGVGFLDKFIERCATRARRANAQFIPLKRRS
jgi:hypothetical protein